jgi:hypothetical protein
VYYHVQPIIAGYGAFFIKCHLNSFEKPDYPLQRRISWILHVADPFIIPKNQFLKRPAGIWDLVFKYPVEQNP